MILDFATKYQKASLEGTWGWVPASVQGERAIAGGCLHSEEDGDVRMEVMCVLVTSSGFYDLIAPPEHMYAETKELDG